MKTMPENNNGSAAAGSPNPGATGPDSGQPAGTGPKGPVDANLQKNYEELEKRLGTQGKELGDYKGFVKSISPILDKLEEQPELIQAILDGKIDANLAKAAMEGKISIESAQQVSEAHDKIKKDLGAKGYEKATPEEIKSLITDEVQKAKREIDKKFSDAEELHSFKERTDKFVKNTPDFTEYSQEIEELILNNPNVDDIETAYHIVKGKKLQGEKVKEDQKKAGEAAKYLAANAAGGGSISHKLSEDKNMVDKLIGNISNPNIG